MIIYAFIGAIKHLKDSGQLDDLQEISCSSAGALIGMFYVFTRGDVDRLLKIAIEAPLSDLAKPDIRALMEKFGLIDADRFERYIIRATDGVDPTFAELYAMNPIKLHVPTYDIVMGRTIYMSVDTTPDMKVSHAVRRSVAIPLIMTPVDRRYVDGSVAEETPCAPFLGRTDVLEILFKFPPQAPKRPRTFFQYLYMIVWLFMRNRARYSEFPRLNLQIDSKYELFNFSMSLDQKLELYREGYAQSSARSRSDRGPSAVYPKSLSCSRELCTGDPGVESGGLCHPVDGDSGENLCLRPESQLSDPQETCQSAGDVSPETSHSVDDP